MKKIERKLGDLTASQKEVVRGLQHCLEAGKFCIQVTVKGYNDKEYSLDTARDFIKSTLHNLEDTKKLEWQMWEKIRKQYELNDDEFKRTWIDIDNGTVNILTPEYFEASMNGRMDIQKFNVMWGL